MDPVGRVTRVLILRELYLWHALLRGQQEDELGCEPSLNCPLPLPIPILSVDLSFSCRSLLLLPISTRILKGSLLLHWTVDGRWKGLRSTIAMFAWLWLMAGTDLL